MPASIIVAPTAAGSPGGTALTGAPHDHPRGHDHAEPHTTQPPGNTAYNVSKAGVKTLTEGLAHSSREATGERVTANLLIPGYTHTGMTARGPANPAAAWSAEQMVDYMLAGVKARDFYILCPDNETTREQDAKRIAWAAADVSENRPALSCWHPAWEDAFARFMAG